MFKAIRPKCSDCGHELILVHSGLTCMHRESARIHPIAYYVANSPTPVSVRGLQRTVSWCSIRAGTILARAAQR